MLRLHLHFTLKNNQQENQRNIQADSKPVLRDASIWKDEIQDTFRTYGQWPSARFICLALLTLTATDNLEVNNPTSNSCLLSMLI